MKATKTAKRGAKKSAAKEAGSTTLVRISRETLERIRKDAQAANRKLSEQLEWELGRGQSTDVGEPKP